jgi:hypothetical protein
VINLKAWVCLLGPLNLLDLAFKMKKMKTKQKALVMIADGNEKFLCLPYLP